MSRFYRNLVSERTIVIIVGIVLYLALIGFVIYTQLVLISRVKTNLCYDAEKAYHTAHTLKEKDLKESQLFDDLVNKGITNIAIFDTGGKVIEAPLVLYYNSKLNVKDIIKDISDIDLANGYIVEDRHDREVIYLRLYKIQEDKDGVELPGHLILVRYYGNIYFNLMAKIKLSSIIIIMLFTTGFVLVINIYIKNSKYEAHINRQEKLANLGQAARTITHEIKNPLSILNLQVSILSKSLSNEYKEDLDIIKEEIDRLTLITNKISSYLQDPKGLPEKIELIGFVDNLASKFSAEIIVNKYNLKSVYINFDRDKLRSVFENLIKNAIESTSREDNLIEIEFIKKKKDIIIEVKDRGDGIDNKLRKELFDPFFTTKVNGSGIGLAITKKFINAQNGKINIYSRQDKKGVVAKVTIEMVSYESIDC